MRRTRLYIAAGVAFLMGFPLAEEAQAQVSDFITYAVGFSLSQVILGLTAQS